MKVLVTGAGGFVGRYLVPSLMARGHQVTAAVHPDQRAGMVGVFADGVTVCPFNVTEPETYGAILDGCYEGVVHLAAIASGSLAMEDPGYAWEVNAAGTARLAEMLGSHRKASSAVRAFLLISTLEVYGAGSEAPRRETDAVTPCSPYAASKLGGEIAAMEVHRRLGLPVIIARPTAHTGPGQDRRHVVPAFAGRILEAKARNQGTVPVGNLTPVRDFIHVQDAVAGYCALLEAGRPGEVYNVGRGAGKSIAEVFAQLARAAGADVEPWTDSRLARPVDVPHLVADGSKLQRATGWQPHWSVDQLLEEAITHEEANRASAIQVITGNDVGSHPQ